MSGEPRAGPGLGDLENELTCSVCAPFISSNPVGLSGGRHRRALLMMLYCILHIAIWEYL